MTPVTATAAALTLLLATAAAAQYTPYYPVHRQLLRRTANEADMPISPLQARVPAAPGAPMRPPYSPLRPFPHMSRALFGAPAAAAPETVKLAPEGGPAARADYPPIIKGCSQGYCWQGCGDHPIQNGEGMWCWATYRKHSDIYLPCKTADDCNSIWTTCASICGY